MAQVFVKNRVTEKFLAVDGTWKRDCSQAHSFKSPHEAALFCALHAIKNSEIILQLAAGEFGTVEFSLPIEIHSRSRMPLDD